MQLGAVSGKRAGPGREKGAVSGSFLSKLGKVAWEIGAVGWGKGWAGQWGTCKPNAGGMGGNVEAI